MRTIKVFLEFVTISFLLFMFWLFGHDFPGSHGKESACNVGDLVQSSGWEDLRKGKATHSSILDWRILWTEEPGMVHRVAKSQT